MGTHSHPQSHTGSAVYFTAIWALKSGFSAQKGEHKNNIISCYCTGNIHQTHQAQIQPLDMFGL